MAGLDSASVTLQSITTPASRPLFTHSHITHRHPAFGDRNTSLDATPMVPALCPAHSLNPDFSFASPLFSFFVLSPNITISNNTKTLRPREVAHRSPPAKPPQLPANQSVNLPVYDDGRFEVLFFDSAPGLLGL